MSESSAAAAGAAVVAAMVMALVAPPVLATGQESPSQQDGVRPKYVDPGPPPVNDRTVSALKREFGVSTDEARERLRRQLPATDLGEYIAERLPDSYAGAYFDHESNGAFVILLTTKRLEEAQLDELLRGYPFPAYVRFRQVSHSESELETKRLEVVREQRQLVNDGVPLLGVHIDFARNRVILVLEQRDGTYEGELRKRYGAQWIDIDIDRDGSWRDETPDTCHTRTHCVGTGPLRGGLQAWHQPSTTSGCTYSYAGFNSAGARYMITAGHCARYNEIWYQGMREVGRVRATVSPYGQTRNPGTATNFDGARIYIHPSAGWATSYYVWASGEARLLQMQRVRGRSGINTGAYVCTSGWMTGESCGSIYAVRTSNNIGLTDGFRYRQDRCTTGGDSGAPAFTRYNNHHGPPNHEAYGIHSSASNCRGTAAYASRIPSQLDIQVHTVTNQP